MHALLFFFFFFEKKMKKKKKINPAFSCKLIFTIQYNMSAGFGGYSTGMNWNRRIIRRTTRRRKPGTLSKCAQVAEINKLKSEVAKIKKGETAKEWKTHDDTETSVSILNDGTNLYLLTGIQQGDRSLDREGLVIRIHSLWVKMVIASNTTTNANQLIRVMIFRDNNNDNDTTAPAVSGDLLEGTNVLDFREHRIKGRYTVYYDKIVNLNPKITGIGITHYKEYYKKFKMAPRCYYTNTTAADISKGQLYIMFLGNSASNQATVSYKARVKFTD